MAYVVMVHVVTACIVTAYVIMVAYIIMAYIVMAYVVMAYLVMAHEVMALHHMAVRPARRTRFRNKKNRIRLITMTITRPKFNVCNYAPAADTVPGMPSAPAVGNADARL